MVKYRRKALSGAALDRMQEVCLGVAEKMGFQLMELNGEANNFPERGGLPLTRRSRKEIYWFVISLALAAASDQDPSRAVHSSRSWLASRRCSRRRMISAR